MKKNLLAPSFIVMVVGLLITTISCVVKSDPHKRQLESVFYEKIEGEIETREKFHVETSSEINTYFLYTETRSQTQRCQESYGRSTVFVPLEYCQAVLKRVQEKLNQKQNQ